jgi:hypothetical protein
MMPAIWFMCAAFVQDCEAWLGYDVNPLYLVLHESIYCQAKNLWHCTSDLTRLFHQALSAVHMISYHCPLFPVILFVYHTICLRGIRVLSIGRVPSASDRDKSKCHRVLLRTGLHTQSGRRLPSQQRLMQWVQQKQASQSCSRVKAFSLGCSRCVSYLVN